jgi:hypothetical protein
MNDGQMVWNGGIIKWKMGKWYGEMVWSNGTIKWFGAMVQYYLY